MVARFVRDEEVQGSNPCSPTTLASKGVHFYQTLSCNFIAFLPLLEITALVDIKGSVFVVVVWLLVSSTWAATTPSSTAELVDKLQQSLTAAAKAKSDSPNTPSGMRYVESSTYLMANIRQTIARGDINSLQQSLAQIKMAFPDEAIGKLCDTLLETVQKEAADREQEFLEKSDALIDKAVKAAFAAKEPKELDPLILELSRLSRRPTEYNQSELMRRTSEKCGSATTFLCRWQDYLMQAKSGNAAAAQQALKEISQNTSSYPFVPRSEILSRIRDVPEAVSTPEKMPVLSGKTLADLDSIQNQIDILRTKNPNSNPLNQLNEAVGALIRAKNQLDNGLISDAFNYCTRVTTYGNNSGLIEQLSPLRQELLMKVLPVYLGISKSYPATPKDSPTDYLLRVIKESREKADWRLTWKTLEVYRSVAFYNGTTPGWLTADIQGCSYFIIGQNQEKAGLYTDAVRSYRRVISQPGENLPLKEATDRMEAIKREHPEDFAAADKAVPTYPVSYPPPTTNNPAFNVPR